jgi:uncharacterized membrane protein
MYNQIRIFITLFVSIVFILSIIHNNYLLSTASILTGLIFMALVRSKTKIKLDERGQTIQEKATRITYAIFAPTIGIAAFLLLLPSKGGISIFRNGEWLYIESLGMIFAYLTLFLIALYAISYRFFNKKYGGSSYEE